jgi:hypothetical protein
MSMTGRGDVEWEANLRVRAVVGGLWRKSATYQRVSARDLRVAGKPGCFASCGDVDFGATLRDNENLLVVDHRSTFFKSPT